MSPALVEVVRNIKGVAVLIDSLEGYDGRNTCIKGRDPGYKADDRRIGRVSLT